MQPDGRHRLARRLAASSAAVALACAAWLVAEHAAVLVRAPAEQGRVEALEAGVKTDFAVAEGLHEERKQQTDASLARDARSRAVAWVLLAAGVAFVGSGKWLASQRPPRLPGLEALVAARLAPATAGDGDRSRRSAAPAGGSPEAVDLAFIDELVGRLGRGREAAIPMLQAVQNHYRYLPDEALQRICELTEITPAQVAGTSSFYAQFRRSPVGRHVVRVCHGTACHVAGADQITQELRRHLEIPAGEDTDARRLFTIDKVACLGCCSLAPVMMIEEDTAGRLTPASARAELDLRAGAS